MEQSKKTNPFKELKPELEAPERLKPKVMQTLGMAKILINMAEMFTVNYLKTLAGLFSVKNGTDNDSE